MKAFLAFLPSLACAVFSGCLAWRKDSESSGWRWFLFAAVVLAGIAHDTVGGR